MRRVMCGRGARCATSGTLRDSLRRAKADSCRSTLREEAGAAYLARLQRRRRRDMAAAAGQSGAGHGQDGFPRSESAVARIVATMVHGGRGGTPAGVFYVAGFEEVD